MMNLDAIKSFIDKLNAENSAEWYDSLGNYNVQIGEGLLEEYLESHKCKIVASSFLDIKPVDIENFHQIVTIGGFQVHNQGKYEAQKQKIELTTIPIPLSNDSFGTNRYSVTDNEQSPSTKSVYPRRTIFDLKELTKIGFRHSINGVGEFIGLYFSIIDYAVKDDRQPDMECLAYIIDKFYELLQLHNNGNERETLRCIANLLIIKCLIMRTSEDYRIACGIDHSIARIFEREQNMPHGKAVYIGCLITCLLLPEWEKWGLSLSALQDMGQKFGLLKKGDIDSLRQTSIRQLVLEAINIRKDRKTMLQRLTVSQLDAAQRKLEDLKWVL